MAVACGPWLASCKPAHPQTSLIDGELTDAIVDHLTEALTLGLEQQLKLAKVPEDHEKVKHVLKDCSSCVVCVVTIVSDSQQVSIA